MIIDIKTAIIQAKEYDKTYNCYIDNDVSLYVYKNEENSSKYVTTLIEYYDDQDNFIGESEPYYKGLYSDSEVEKEMKIEEKRIDKAFSEKIFEKTGLELINKHIYREDRSHNVVIIYIQLKLKNLDK